MSPFINDDKKHNIEDENGLTEQKINEDSMVKSETASSQEEEDIIPVPPVEDPFYGLDRQIAYFGFSQPGQSHLDAGTPCQDRCYSAYIPEKGILITAVADGVGSCALSDLGAHTAVHSSVEFIRTELQSNTGEQLDGTLAGSILRNAFQHAYDQVELTAKQHEQLLYSLQSTLTVAIYDGSNLYFGHAGDDGIVVLTEERTLAMATSRHKGEEASSVYPLQGRTTWQFGMVPNAAAFVMATDGVLDAFVSSSFEKNRVYYPFVEPIFTASYETVDSVKQACATIFAYMSGEQYRSAVTDDLSIVAVMNLDKLPACLPDFDLDAWNEETKKYKEKVRKALYDQSKALPHERKSKRKQNEPAQDPSSGMGSRQPAQQPNASVPPHHNRASQPADRYDVFPPNKHTFRFPRRKDNPPINRNPYSTPHDYYGDPNHKIPRSPYTYENVPPDRNAKDPDYDQHTQNTSNIPPQNKPKKHRRLRPQAAAFWSFAVLFSILSVYYGIKLIVLIVSLISLFI